MSGHIVRGAHFFRSPELLNASPVSYYLALEEWFGDKKVRFDPNLKAYVFGDYELCKNNLLNAGILGRPTSESLESMSAHLSQESAAGLSILKKMLFFQKSADEFTTRKQSIGKVLTNFSNANCMIEDRIKMQLLNTNFLQEQATADAYAIFREFNFDCAQDLMGIQLKLTQETKRHLIRVVMLLDGKTRSYSSFVKALVSVSWLADYLSNSIENGNDRLSGQNLADLVMLFVTACESTAFLLFTYYQHCNRLPIADADEIQKRLTEALRIDSPIQVIRKTALSKMQGDHFEIQPGEDVYLHVGFANHDQSTFPEPHLFATDRMASPISFGMGLSRCLGAGYAMSCARKFVLSFQEHFEINIKNEGVRWANGFSGRGCAVAHSEVKKI